MLAKIKASLLACAGDIVFGVEDGAVSILGLLFGVTAASSDTKSVLVAGCSAAGAAAVSMMAGVYLEAQTQREAGQASFSPAVRALWMLGADFMAAAGPIAPFVVEPVPQARLASAIVTMTMLGVFGAWRGRLARGPILRPMVETMTVGFAAALAGLLIGHFVAGLFG